MNKKSVRFVLKVSISLIVFFLALPLFFPRHTPLTLEINAKSDHPDVWTVTYQLAPRNSNPSSTELSFQASISQSQTFNTLRFPFPDEMQARSLKQILIYPGKIPGSISIQNIRLKSFISIYNIPPQSLLSRIRLNQTFIQIQPLKTELRAHTLNNAVTPSCIKYKDDFLSLNYRIRHTLPARLLLIIPPLLLSLLTFFLISSIFTLPKVLGGVGNPFSKGFRPAGGTHHILLLLIVIPIIFSSYLYIFIGKVSSVDTTEKRTLTPAPALDLNNMPTFTQQFQDFFNDRIWFRSPFVRINNKLQLRLFDISPVPKVIVGKDDWLFYRSELAGDGNTIDDFQGKVPYSQQELEQIKRNIQTNARWCSQRGIFFLIVLVPNKETIYSEYLPESIRKGKLTRLQQIMDYLKNDNLPVYDLTPILIKHKPEHQIYYRGGTHWNQYGAYYGYRQIIQWISPGFPQLKPLPLDAFDVQIDEHSAADQWFGFKENREIRLTLKPSYPLPSSLNAPLSMIAFRDSFIKDYPHFYQYHFKPFIEISNRAFDTKYIDPKKTNIVLWEIIERTSDILLYMK